MTKILRTEQHVSDISSQSAIQIQHIKRIFNIEGYEKDIFFFLIFILFLFSMQLILFSTKIVGLNRSQGPDPSGA